ncbi:MAG: hypothetical protein EOP88_13620 [Verrucomicrobiaceae bacterium]|nr:MAG: hypothetical protein EOP88_13620 [Verrucomicrobiaceae bacterium]
MKPRNVRFTPLPAAAILVLSLASGALADNVTMLNNDPANTTSFTGVGQWSNGAAPAPEHDYFTATFTVRTPTAATGDFTFGGKSLTIDPTGRLLGKSTGTLNIAFTNGTGLFLNGGNFYQANNSTSNSYLGVSGKITVNAGTSTFIGAAGALTGTGNSDTLEILATVTGTGNLTVAGNTNASDNCGITRITSANPDYTGFITIAQPDNISSTTHRLLQLNNLNALQNATLTLSTTAPHPLSFASGVNTAAFYIGALAGTSQQRLVDTAGSPVTLDAGGNNSDSTHSGVLVGSGSLVKSGTGNLTLNGVNVFTGNTTVSAGTHTLRYGTLADTSTVTVANGAALALEHGTVDKVASLVLGGAVKAAGIYNEANSGGLITGTGSIEVVAAPTGSNHVVLLAADAVGTASINADLGTWSTPGTPAVPNKYYTGPYTLRTPAGLVSETITFGGSTLSLTSGGRLLGKLGAANAGNTSVQTLGVNLILDGGNIDQAGGSTSTTLRLEGTVESRAEAFVGALGTTNTNCETLDFAGPISGSSFINVGGTGNGGANRGIVRLSAANPFTGTVTVNQPGAAIAHTTDRLLQLNHLDALRFGKLLLATTEADGVSFASAVNTGNFRVGGLAGISGLSQKLEDTAAAPVTLDIGGNNLDSEFYGTLTGSGSIVKSGTGTLYLFAQNSYTGNTSVTGGTLSVDFPVLSDTGAVNISADATLNLVHSETDVVGSLVLAGVVKGPGTYDSTNSGGRITGSGKIQVTGAPSGSFSTYMDSFPGLSTGDKAANADPDKDGISNLVEYALAGFNPTTPNNLANTLAAGTLFFTKRADAVTNNDILYAIETSANLGAAPGSWTTVTPTVNDATTLSYALPAGQGKLFARLRITRK